jgi:predicted TIM-barrel fold metal-dependent hydrolase
VADASIDVQQHFAPPSLRAFLQEIDPSGAHLALASAANLADRLVEMDEIGMTSAVVSIPKLGSYSHDGLAKTAELVRRCNDELLEAAAAHPGRFAVWMALPFPSVDACIEELDRLSDESLVRGVILFAASEHWQVDDPSFEPIYAAIATRGLPAMLHPADDSVTRLPMFEGWLLSASIGSMLESSVAGARFILSGMFDRVPDLTMVIPHLGGFLPYLEQRIADQSRSGDAEHDVLHYLRRNCITDTCSFHPPALTCAAETFTTARMMLGSDYPFRGSLARAVDDVALGPLPADSVPGVLAGNAARLGLGFVA